LNSSALKKTLSPVAVELVSGRPYWPIHNREPSTYAALDEDLACDVAVIGGGITGALAAYELTRKGFDTVLLEQNRFASGSTRASTALLSYEYDLLLSHLCGRIGERDAMRCYELSYQAIGRIERTLKDIEDRCAWAKKSSLRVARSESVLRTFEQEAAARNRTPMKVELLDRETLLRRFGISGLAALVSGRAYQIDPFSFTKSLIRCAATKGLRAYERSKATQLDLGDKGLKLKVGNGRKISARSAVFATGYESEKYLPRKVGILNTDYCFVSHPLRDLGRLGECHLVEHGSDYMYLSTFGNRVMAGLEATSFDSPKRRRIRMSRMCGQIEERVAQYLPHRNLAPEYAWAATFARSKDSLPYMGELPAWPRVIFLLGYGGNGIASSAMLAGLLADKLAGGRNRDVGLFRFDR
jgi:glycine/D-amino acid oxidase-like deaminating enzyme